MRLRRAVALNLSSSSCANFFSKPSSRLSKVVIGTSRVVPGAMAMTLHIGGKWPNQRGVAGAVVRGGRCGGRRHCAPPPDRLGFRRRSDSTFPASRAAPAAADRVFKGATAPHGFPQATVHADE